MYYVYVLKSLKDSNFYVGRTGDMKNRWLRHNRGLVPSTKHRRPLKFVYCEICNNVKDAARREIYLKTAWGKRYIKNRLANDL